MAVGIQFDATLHQLGERCAVDDPRITEALAWWVGAELIRRHPRGLRIVETHPLDGFYDCRSIYRSPKRASESPTLVVHMNIQGGAHLTQASWFGPEGGDRFNWLEVLLCRDRRRYVVEQLERVEGLTSPAHSPSTTKESIGPRAIAAFLQRSVLGPQLWRARLGVDDSSWGDPVRAQLFDAIPGAATAAASHRVPDVQVTAQHERFWFLVPEGHDGEQGPPAVAVDTWSGLLWTPVHTEPIDLLAEYNATSRSIDALVSRTFPPAL